MALSTIPISWSPDATMDETLTSQIIDLVSAKRLSVTLAAASATHVGTIAVDGSDDGITWVAETLSTTPSAASGVALSARLDLTLGCRYARIRYVYSSGTGTLTGAYTVKE